MADKEIKNVLGNITKSVTDNSEVINDMSNDVSFKMLVELIENINQRLSDMSKKFDEVLNIGLKKPKVNQSNKSTDELPKKKKTVTKKEESKSSEPKLIKNIMTYFKVKYLEDQTAFNDILEENQAEALFKEHAEKLKNKKGDAKIKAQTSILYTNLTKAQKNKVRERMIDENDAVSINNDDDIEADVESD